MKIMLFGSLSQAVEQSEIEMEAEYPLTVSELRQTLTKNFPTLESKTFSVALNRKIAADSLQVKASDEVVLLPPFAGG